MAIETRMGATPLEVREDGDTLVLEGYASTFNQPYDMGYYRETVAPGAFKRTLGRKPDVRLLLNHEGLPLARTTSGTMELSEDSTGLKVRAFLDPADPDVQRIVPKMRRGDLNQMSFGFRIDGSDGQEWSSDRTERVLRSLDINDGDTSIVTYPANPGTRVGFRAKDGLDLEPVIGALLDMEKRGASHAEADAFLARVLAYFRGADLAVEAPTDAIDQPVLDAAVDVSPESDERAAALLATERRIAMIRALTA